MKMMLIMMLRKGWQKIISTMNATHSRQHENFAHRAGPHSSLPSTNGFLKRKERESEQDRSHHIHTQTQTHRHTHRHTHTHITHQENLNRPTGGGRKGFVLGSLRALPTGKSTAWSLGQICTL